MARELSERLGVPVFTVDHVQFEPGWKRADLEKVAAWHREIMGRPDWILDGWGAWELQEERYLLADLIVFIDFPLETHLAWARRREEMSAAGECREEPPGCRYADVHDLMTETLERVDREMLPGLREMLEPHAEKVVHLTAPEAVRAWLDDYVGRSETA
jgi:adenylate kinase family enzyme